MVIMSASSNNVNHVPAKSSSIVINNASNIESRCASLDEFVTLSGSDRREVRVGYTQIERIVRRKAREQASKTVVLTGRRFDPIRRKVQYFDAERRFTVFSKSVYKNLVSSYFKDVGSLSIHNSLTYYLSNRSFKTKLERLSVLNKLKRYGNKLAHSFDLSSLDIVQYETYYLITAGLVKDHYFIVNFFKKVKEIYNNRCNKHYKRDAKFNQALARNRFILLPVDPCEEVKVADSDDEDYVTIPLPLPQQRSRYHIDDVSISDLEALRLEFQELDTKIKRVYRECTQKVRDANLLARLRDIIRRMAARRTGQSYEEMEMRPVRTKPLFCIVDSDDEVQPEMMTDQTPDSQQSGGAVVLNALQGEEVQIPIEQVSDSFWINNSTSDVIVDQKHASNMEILAKKFTWSSDDSSGASLFTMDLPGSVVADNMNHPAAMLFGQYAYWNGDINVRIHINTTPFHIGLLIFSWYYAAHFDAIESHRDNIASSVQLPHVFYNASEGNDVVLKIPFRNYRSMLCTRKKQDDSLPLYLGTLRCHVFNPLTSDKSTAVDGYVHINFENASFTGIMPRAIVQPEMMPTKSLIKAAEGALHILDRCTNMDNPSHPAVPIMQTPQFSDSFATGTNDVNNVHMLRLDPLGQTQHPIGSSVQKNETNINNIVRQWGYLTSVTWNSEMIQGKIIYNVPVSPELDYNHYFSTEVTVSDVKRTAYVLPPVSVVSSINAYNRGSLEYKFQIINSRYHTGALVATFTPILSNVTLAQALQSYNITMDVGNVSEYVFKVPYINERPFNPRFNRMDATDLDPILAPIGELNVFVLNQLRGVTGASNHIYINIFIRAGDDFEVAVPVAPLYTVLYDVNHKEQSEYIYPITDSDTIGVDNWRYATQAPNLGVIKSGATADAIMQFKNIKPFAIYQFDPLTDNCRLESPFSLRQVLYPLGNTAAVDNQLQYICMYITNDDRDKYKYGITFTNYTDAANYVTIWSRYVSQANKYPNSPNSSEWIQLLPTVTRGYLLAPEGSYRKMLGSISSWRWKLIRQVSNNEANDFELIEAEGNEVLSDPTISTLASTMNGMRLFGERFVDLKDYCRRFQPYGGAIMSIDAGSVSVLCRIPLSPLGLRTDANNGHVIKYTREGMIPFIASAFRFYRGSLRMKIMLCSTNTNTADGEIVYIQHKPDIIPQDRDISVTQLTSDSRTSWLLQSGYAYTAFSMVVNNSITVEIPCYCPTNLLMLQSPNFTRKAETLHYSLGVLDIYLAPNAVKQAKYYLQVHYSLADDMDYSCFVGFPPMMPLYKTRALKNSPQIQPEMADEKACTSKQALEQQAKEKKDKEEVVPQGPLSNFNDFVKSKLKKAAYSEVRKDLDLPKTEKGKVDDITKIVKDLIKKVGNEHAHLIYSAISQIVHCINNFSMGTCAIAFVTILAHMGFHFFDRLQNFAEWFTDLFSKKTSVIEPQAGDNKTETSSMDGIKKSIISTIVSESARMMGVAWDWTVRIPDWLNMKFFEGLRSVSSALNQFILLIKNVVNSIPYVFEWIGKLFRPKKWLRSYFSKRSDFVDKWISDVEYVTDPANQSEIRLNHKFIYYIELLVMVGRDIVAKANKLESASTHYLSMLKRRLDDVYTEVIARNIGAGSIGVEPFCFCLHGESQVGKTFVVKQLAQDCLSAVNYTFNGPIDYTRCNGTKHWDGLENQPICILDDFGHIMEPSIAAQYLEEFIILKSKATFTPSRADISDKGKKYAPLIIAMTMNKPFTRFNDVVATCTAWQNRRDMLIEVHYQPPDEYKDVRKPGDLPPEIRDKFKHMKFSIHKYVSIPDNSNGSVDSSDRTKEKIEVHVPESPTSEQLIKTKLLSYEQMRWYLIKQFADRYEWMKQEYAKDFKRLTEFQPKIDESFERNLQHYLDHLKSSQKIFNDRERDTIKRLQSGKVCNACGYNTHVCLCPLSMFSTKHVGDLTSRTQPESEEGLPIYLQKTFTEKEIIRHVEDLFGIRLKLEMGDKIYSDYKYVKTHMHSDKALTTYPSHVFFKHMCIHTLIQAGIEFECLLTEDDDKTWHLVTSNEMFAVDPADCTCVKQGLLKEDIYKCQVRQLVDNWDKVPSLQQVEPSARQRNAKLVAYENRQREACKDFLKEKVDKSYLTESAASTLIFVGVVGTLLTMITAFHFVCSSIDVNNDVKRQKKFNELKADAIRSHQPTEACLVSCHICRPEMAYDQNKQISERTRKIVVPKAVVAEMGTEQRAMITNKLRRNTFFLVAITPDLTMVASRCLGIADRWFIAIDHYFDKFLSLPNGTRMYYKHSMYECEVYLHEIAIQKILNSSIRVCSLPARIPAFANIVDKFAKADMIPNVSPQASLIVVEHEDSMRKIQEYEISWYSQRVTFVDDTLHVPHIVDKKLPSTKIDHYWMYQTSGKGLCGSVLVSMMNISTPLLGIHIAGMTSGKCGYAEVICQETLRSIVNPKLRVKDVELEGQMFDGELITLNQDVTKSRAVVDGYVNFVGVVPNKYAFKPSPKSKLLHSMCYNQITQSTYDVPHLSPKDERFEGSPMVKGCNHHGNPVRPFNVQKLDIVAKHVEELVLAKVPPKRIKVGPLSVTESIEGIPDIPGYDAMEFDTSEGFPFLSMRPNGAHDKRWLFDLEVTNSGYKVNSINPVLIDVMERKMTQRINKIVPLTIFTDCLKDAKLPKEKCGNTRIFSVSPVDFTIQFRQYFYDFTVAFQDARFDVESAIGINVDSYEWNNMVHMLLDNSTAFVCGDYSKFGPRLMSECVQKFFDIIIEWYKVNGDDSEENATIRYIMGQEIAFSKHLMFNFVYEVYCGAPSGCPITTILNNGVNMMYLRYAYLEMSKGVKNSPQYRNAICSIFYGDDLIMTVKPEVVEWFNANTLSSFFREFDIKFTNALKSNTFVNSVTVFSPETSFLKRTVKRHPFRPIFVGAMDKRAIEETCNWVYKDHNEPEASVVACESMLLNAFGHGPMYYDNLRQKCIKYWQSHNIVPNIPFWAEVDARLFEE